MFVVIELFQGTIEEVTICQTRKEANAVKREWEIDSCYEKKDLPELLQNDSTGCIIFERDICTD